jgi:FtsP/CotA-like multicopper oxidase with cupredoxin domain
MLGPPSAGASAAGRTIAGAATGAAPRFRKEERMSTPTQKFPRDTAGLPAARPTEVVELSDGDRYTLHIGPVTKRIGDATVRMLAYNGSIPGPTMRVPEGAEVVVDIENEGDLEATVHWHGLRLENRYDGTHETQELIPVGARYTARVTFPDAGVYWYHPHVREDYGQELGLYGNCIVVPADPDYWPPVHRELALTLDDVLIEDGQIAPFSPDETTYAAMGRFGNVLLVAGEPELELTARAGEVVRLYLTNTANTRVFKVALPGARMKLVGGDSGRVERETFVEDVILAPSERVVVDVLFESPGELTLEHRTPDRTYKLADVTVSGEEATPSLAEAFADLRSAPELTAERERLMPLVDAPPDKTLAFVAEMDMGEPEVGVGEALVYTCPMHPEVSSEEAGRCPACGMKLIAQAAPTGYVCPMHPEVTSETPDRCPQCGMKLLPARLVQSAAAGHHEHAHHEHGEHEHHDDEEAARAEGHEASHAHGGLGHSHATADGIEWEDDMVEVNKLTTPANTRWSLVDRTTDAANHDIQWQFRVGDRVKIRLVNEMDSDHPMHHPFHIHGAGRFLVLARDDVVEQNLVWKDTVLVRTGETVDIVLDVTNVGLWMAHCHIAEHHESGMMFSFEVTA